MIQLPRAGGRWTVLAIICAAVLVVVIDVTVLHIAAPAMAEDLEPSAVALLWVIDIYPLVVAPLLVASGALGDRFGRKRMLLAGLLVFGFASVLAAFAWSVAVLIAARALMGVGGALILPATMSIVRSVFEDRDERRTADAYVDHGTFKGLGTDYARLPRGGDDWPVSSHTFGQSDIELDGDVAHAESYCIFHYKKVNENLNRMRAGILLIRYFDRFERREGGPWKVAFRRIVIDYSHEHDVMDIWPEEIISTRGVRSEEDLAYHRERLVP